MDRSRLLLAAAVGVAACSLSGIAMPQEHVASDRPWILSEAGKPQLLPERLDGGKPVDGDAPVLLFEELPVPPQIKRLPAVGPSALQTQPGRGPLARKRLARPRVGVVLGGGGAAGVCHVGVLQVLEEYGIPVDCIAGTSMGSIVAGLYATGLPSRQLEQIVYQFRWDEILAEPRSHATKYERRKTDDYLFPPAISLGIEGGHAKLVGGFVSGQNLTLQLRRMLAAANCVSEFDHLPVPFRTVATDLETGEKVVFRRGNLATAIRASMSIPGVFPPVRYGERLLIDGGVRNNVPVDLAREMGADVVIVVRIPPDLKSREKLDSLFSVSSQALTIMAAHDSSHQANGLSDLDILIEPQMNSIGSLDFGRAREAVALGAAAARQADGQLRRLARLVGVETASEKTATPPGPSAIPSRPPIDVSPTPAERVVLATPQTFIADRIRISNTSPIATNESIACRLTVQPGQPFSLDQLEQDIKRIYGTDNFGNVDYELGTNEVGEPDLEILTTPDSRGATLMSLGVGLEENFSGDSFYSASLNYVARGLNDLGGEARFFGQLGSRQRLLADFFQPLEPTQTSFLRPFLMSEGRVQPLMIRHQTVAEFWMRDYTAGLEAGRTLGDYGVVTAGTFVETSDAKLVTGMPMFDTKDDDTTTGGFYVGVKHDSLDSYFFPKNGLFAEAKYSWFGNWFGDAEPGDLVTARFIGAKSYGPHVGIVRAEAVIDDIFSANIIRSESTTGGFLRLSGFAKHEIIASRRVQVSTVYMREIRAMMGTRVRAYCGISGELGYFDGLTLNADTGRPIVAGSAFLALDTPLGPLFAGYGVSDAEAHAPFVAMGQVF